MIQKKVCMIGATMVGKTSLVRQFVQSIFSEKYHSTLGVKVDKKIVKVENHEVSIMLWDMQGEDNEFQIRPSFLRGTSGYMLVVDSTRKETLDTAKIIHERIETEIGSVAYQVLFNKWDLEEERAISSQDIEEFGGSNAIMTSAKTGENVEEAFNSLALKMIENM